MNLLYVLNDNLLYVDRLRDQATFDETGLYEETAVVTVTVKDQEGNELSGPSWPLSLDFVSGSDGKYLVVLDQSLALSDGEKYIGEVDAEAPGGMTGHWKVQLDVVERWV